VHSNPFRRADDQLLFGVNWLARHSGPVHGSFLAYAKYGVVLFALLLLAGLVLARNSKSSTLAAAGWAPVATLVAVALNQPLGRLVGEARPYVTHPRILRLAAPTSDFSFPSDHAVMGGAVAVGLLLVNRRLGLAAAVLALVLAFARVYIGAHYPWDVLGGLTFGAAVTGLGWLLLRRPLTTLTRWLRGQPGVCNWFGQMRRPDGSNLVRASVAP
jgi:membrane-associated phospholipid phosphatase